MYLFHDGFDDNIYDFLVLFVKILLFVVEFVEDDFEIRPRRLISFKEPEHVVEKDFSSFFCGVFINWFDPLQNENTFFCSFFFKIQQE